ncbi:MAG: secondary thiamine-phosphate synthase enzyme YjbQ [Candidatus Eremiobacterota bacterium]
MKNGTALLSNKVQGEKAGPAIHVKADARGQSLGQPRVYLSQMTIRSSRGPQFVDITDQVETMLQKTGMTTGQVLVYSQHTTAAVIINENEPLLIEDMKRFLGRLADPAEIYQHNDFSIRTVNMCDDECDNAHSHLQHLTLGCSVLVPIQEGRLTLGRWQRIFMIELDRPRERSILVQFMGA